MKKITIAIISLLAFVMASCNGVSPETANAFKGEYWMETIEIGVIDNNEYPLHEASTWTPISIYEKGGKLYVQTEMLGAPDFDNEHPKEVEGTRERPNFIAPYRIPSEAGDTATGIENIETGVSTALFVSNGYIVLSSHGVRLTQTLPIKVKSGSETVLYFEKYKPVEVQLTDVMGNSLGKIHAWYEYGPMVKKGDSITWEVDYKDDYVRPQDQGEEYDRLIHRSVLYKK